MNQHIPDLQKALRHFAKQIKFALNDFNTPLTYQTFWEQTEFVEDGNNAKDCMFNYLYTFADEKYPPYKQDYDPCRNKYIHF